MTNTFISLKRKSLWRRILNFFLRNNDPENEANDNYKNRMMDRYKNK
jgi:hypothetical protein